MAWQSRGTTEKLEELLLRKLTPDSQAFLARFEKLFVVAERVRLFKRLILVDDTFIFSGDAPSLLDYVGASEFGAHVEGTALAFYTHQMREDQVESLNLPPAGLPVDYSFNSGCLVLSPLHSSLFQTNLSFLFEHGFEGDQSFLNYQVFKNDVPVRDLKSNWHIHPALYSQYGDPDVGALLSKFPSGVFGVHVTSAILWYGSADDRRVYIQWLCRVLSHSWHSLSSSFLVSLHALTISSGTQFLQHRNPKLPMVNRSRQNQWLTAAVWPHFFSLIRASVVSHEWTMDP